MVEQQEITVIESKDYRVVYANAFNIVASNNEIVLKVIRVEPQMDANNQQIGIRHNYEFQIIINRDSLNNLHHIIEQTVHQLG